MRALFWAGLGAAAMYLLDPQQGLQRRTLLREQLRRARERFEAGGVPESYPLEEQPPTEAPEGAFHLGR